MVAFGVRSTLLENYGIRTRGDQLGLRKSRFKIAFCLHESTVVFALSTNQSPRWVVDHEDQLFLAPIEPGDLEPIVRVPRPDMECLAPSGLLPAADDSDVHLKKTSMLRTFSTRSFALG